MHPATRALLRRQLLERIYDKMSPEERRAFVRLTMQDRSADEILRALRAQSRALREQSQMLGLQQQRLAQIQRGQQTFGEDFLSNLAANATWDGLAWLARRLLSRI